jgi:hypothetical protein
MKQPTTPVTAPATIGAPFEGGFYGGIIHLSDATFAVVWAPKAQGETKAAWLDSYTSVPGSASCFDSMANTKAMAEAGSDLAKWALGLEINGHADWCIPARDVLELGYRNLKPTTGENCCSFRDGDNASSVPTGYPYTDESPAQTAAEAFKEGGPEAFEARWHWSSTQYSDFSAFLQYFDYGTQINFSKSAEGRARAVRLIQLSA